MVALLLAALLLSELPQSCLALDKAGALPLARAALVSSGFLDYGAPHASCNLGPVWGSCVFQFRQGAEPAAEYVLVRVDQCSGKTTVSFPE